MPDETRVVLVKPGDVLLIGNVGLTVQSEVVSATQAISKIIGTRVVMFADDIDIALLSDGDSTT
jgi:hypothetical protein